MLLVAAPLHAELEAVEVVRRRVLIAASAATAFAIVLGYALATLFARRIRRLEAAAERIAGGEFDEPVVDDGADELGAAGARLRADAAAAGLARPGARTSSSPTPRTSCARRSSRSRASSSCSTTRSSTPRPGRSSSRRCAARWPGSTKLATDLLDLSRLDAGRLSVAEDGFDLGAVGELLVSELGPRAGATQHGLELVPADQAYARGDEARVLQIGRILVENALVHTPAGTTVTVECGAAGGTATLAVTDDGPGIPVAAQEAVFDRFYRLGGTVASGSGLGLAIARELAELMRGRVELVSRPGFTRFALVLPADAGTRQPALVAAEKG